ncbi:DNA-directed RNA polymerase subunit delta [Aneurinibacillus thermoaerophilus]|uniref:DNA-directed RNA polymerase subunit delta n=1 Tax=Aneurinibacillus thermoaerophilus TaxID=143495 RepID=UPI002E1EC285|nr:DNA-directed RNA polymerase subunit delta [Aneurinibacillus thermoaerophilus]MED0681158.1 DNA-directed RNA polymerase subunit delta [Aneurinibacillus thermoaerophilus]MED0766179.1 DNA-directed RNA polymerase subunit delta [Aneurinibacillus thermoaerophilus]
MGNALNLEAEKIQEMAMVDLAYRILNESKKPAYYRDLYKQLTEMKNMSESEAMDMIAQVYTEINLDGRFICLGDNLWGLKRWYLVETQEESAEGSFRGKFALDDDDDYEDEEELEEEYDELDDGDIEASDDEHDDLDADYDEDADEEFESALEDEDLDTEDEDEELDM